MYIFRNMKMIQQSAIILLLLLSVWLLVVNLIEIRNNKDFVIETLEYLID